MHEFRAITEELVTQESRIGSVRRRPAYLDVVPVDHFRFDEARSQKRGRPFREIDRIDPGTVAIIVRGSVFDVSPAEFVNSGSHRILMISPASVAGPSLLLDIIDKESKVVIEVVGFVFTGYFLVKTDRVRLSHVY